MRTTYTPKPGSLGAKVLAHLQANGNVPISGRDIAALCGVPRNNVGPSLKAPVSRGLLTETQIDGTLHCGLGSGAATPGSTAPVKRKTKTKSTRAAAAKKKTRQHNGHTPTPAEPDDTSDGFSAARWMDGDITLHGIDVAEGGAIVINASQASRLLEFLQDQLT